MNKTKCACGCEVSEMYGVAISKMETSTRKKHWDYNWFPTLEENQKQIRDDLYDMGYAVKIPIRIIK